METQNHVEAKGVIHTFHDEDRTLTALAGVNLAVRRGEFVSIIGPSGCGKTTLLRVLGGLLQPTAGTVRIGAGTPREAQQRKDIGFAFQDPALLPWRTVLDNVRLPLQVNGGSRDGSTQAERLVEMVGLRAFACYYPHQLSGGMRQRVALARALVFDPALLLMDEPLGALDEITREAMRYELLRIWESTRKTVVMVTHGIAEAVALSDRVVVMTGLPGRVRESVPVEIPRPREESIERSQGFLEAVFHIKGLLAKGSVNGAGLHRARLPG